MPKCMPVAKTALLLLRLPYSDNCYEEYSFFVRPAKRGAVSLSLLHLILAAAVVAAVAAASATTTTTTTAGYSLIRQHYLDEDLPDGVREPGVARGVDILDVESVQHDLHVPVLGGDCLRILAKKASGQHLILALD